MLSEGFQLFFAVLFRTAEERVTRTPDAAKGKKQTRQLDDVPPSFLVFLHAATIYSELIFPWGNVHERGRTVLRNSYIRYLQNQLPPKTLDPFLLCSETLLNSVQTFKYPITGISRTASTQGATCRCGVHRAHFDGHAAERFASCQFQALAVPAPTRFCYGACGEENASLRFHAGRLGHRSRVCDLSLPGRYYVLADQAILMIVTFSETTATRRDATAHVTRVLLRPRVVDPGIFSSASTPIPSAVSYFKLWPLFGLGVAVFTRIFLGYCLV